MERVESQGSPEAVGPRAGAVPEAVRTSDFGCPNCLWAGAECKEGSLYREALGKRGGPVCVAYAYCD